MLPEPSLKPIGVGDKWWIAGMTHSLAMAPTAPRPQTIPAIDDDWMDLLSSAGWSWEFLRRNPTYLDAYAEYQRSRLHGRERAALWGLRYFEDPALDAASANVFWKMEVCRDVLPVQAVPANQLGPGQPFPFEELDCRITVRNHVKETRKDVLFAKDGCFLQLAVFGECPLEKAALLTPVLADRARSERQREAMRRLEDLVRTGTMRHALYRQETRVRRLKNVLRALDGALAKQPYREIAVAIFGAERVAQEWTDPRDNLRDQVRRAVRCGKELMENGYRQFVG